MPKEAKQTDGATKNAVKQTVAGFHFRTSNNTNSFHVSNNSTEEKVVINGSSNKPKCLNSFLEFCIKSADELPQRQAFYTVDMADVLWKIQEWKKYLPKIEIFYAMKANTDPVLLQLLAMMGLSFDCASAGEIEMALKAGASPGNIILAHTIKTVEELEYASEKGVTLMTFDNEDELLKIHQVYPSAKLLLRISPTNVNCSFDLSDKFGCSEEEALKLLKLANQLELTVVGVSFHVGALCRDPNSYSSTIEIAKRVFDVAKDFGFSFSILDIGGGFFGQSGTQDLFYTMAEGINKSLDEYFSDNEMRIIAEPGTYIVGSAFNLVCTVLGRRCLENTADDQARRHYYLNDGVYGSFFNGVHSYGIQPIPALPQSEMKSRAKYNSKLFGQTCCSEDEIKHSVILPDLKVGERIIWKNMGAYSRGICSTFCGVPLPLSRYCFVKNQRLNLECLYNQSTSSIQKIIEKHVTFIECNVEESRI